ncbi:uncharacterized protein LOC111349722 [Spodoptera litura]|uniref:Uncharacterized protein LOC111349722 n=1 Tax=Spodoptera litura TaxID=69820 RepID=A0A9J7DR16_SPOLT|nr:uncharacterized protein LOC111349722 [Spodoptera litura]
MLKKILILFSFCCAVAQMIPTTKPILLKLTPEQIRNTFDNIMSDDYIGVLAKEFAAQAAKHFVKEMKEQRNVIIGRINESYGNQVMDYSSSNQEHEQNTSEKPQTINVLAQNQASSAGKEQLQALQESQKEEYESSEETPQTQDDKNQNNEVKNVMDSREALKLLNDPSPDGDHLDSRSVETLSGESRDKIPVIEVMKINGAYYRRLLGLI